MRDFYVWYYSTNSKDSIITKMPKILDGKWWQLRKGISCKDWFPADVLFSLNPSRGLVINDAIHSTFSGIHFVSEKFKQLLDGEDVNCEFLPIAIADHDNNRLPEPYYILNVIEKVKCINREESEFEIDSFDDELIETFDVLRLNHSQIPANLKLFRIADAPHMIIIRKDLAIKIKREAGLTGPTYMNVNDWDGFGF